MGVTIGAEVPEHLRDRIDEYKEPDESRSAAIERLIRNSLDAETGDGWRDRAGRAFALLIIMGYPTLAAAGGGQIYAAGFIAFILILVLADPWIDAATDRVPNPINWFRA